MNYVHPPKDDNISLVCLFCQKVLITNLTDSFFQALLTGGLDRS